MSFAPTNGKQEGPLKKYRSRLATLTRDWRTFMGGYDDTVVRASAFDMTQRYSKMNATISSHFLMDAFQMHYRPYDRLVPNPLGKNPWKDIIQEELSDRKYRELNEKTAKNPALAMLASQNFIDAVTGVAKKSQNMIPPDVQDQANRMQPQPQNNQQNNQNQPGQPGGQQPFNMSSFMNSLQLMQTGNYGNQAAASNIMGQMQAAVSGATSQSNQMGAVMSGFTHSGVPMRKLMDVDEMRSILSNYIVIALSNVLRKISVNDPGRSTSKPSPKRGIPIGVKTMRSFSEITDLVPMEYLNDQDLFSYRAAGRKAQVRERFSSMNRFMVYVDKSGSMGGYMKFMGDTAPKIAVACANALALAGYLRSHGGVLVLKLFDTEVQEPMTDMWDIMKTLASISADGGTNISRVLEDVVESGKDYRCIIVSDGIDSIDEDAAKSVKGMDVSSILIGTKNELLEKYTKVSQISEAGSGNIFLEV